MQRSQGLCATAGPCHGRGAAGLVGIISPRRVFCVHSGAAVVAHNGDGAAMRCEAAQPHAAPTLARCACCVGVALPEWHARVELRAVTATVRRVVAHHRVQQQGVFESMQGSYACSVRHGRRGGAERVARGAVGVLPLCQRQQRRARTGPAGWRRGVQAQLCDCAVQACQRRAGKGRRVLCKRGLSGHGMPARCSRGRTVRCEARGHAPATRRRVVTGCRRELDRQRLRRSLRVAGHQARWATDGHIYHGRRCDLI